MRGNIRQRGHSFSLKVSLGKNHTTGKYEYAYETIKGTKEHPAKKRDADNRLAELLNQLNTGTYTKPQRLTLGTFLNDWLASVRGNLAPKTAQEYAGIIRRISPRIGCTPLTQLKPATLQRFYAESLDAGRADGKGGLSAQTVRHIHTLLHKALKNALEWGLIARNPADAAHPPTPGTASISIMNETEIQTFLEAARNSGYYHLYYTILFTGMRRSEALALRWCDVDLMLCQLSVTRSIHKLRDGSYIYRQPKSAKGRRVIALSPSCVQVLREHQENTLNERLLMDISLKDTDLVFCRYDGSPIRPDTITRAWADLARRCGIAAHRLHDARHTHASLMLKQGIHPRVVQERLGHSTISITLDTYSHVAPGLQEAAALRFDSIVNKGVISAKNTRATKANK